MRYLFLLTCLAVTNLSKGQSELTFGFLPEISITHRWAEKWRLGTQIESMQQSFIYQNQQKQEDYKYIRTDITPLLTYQLSPNWGVGLGALTRFENKDFVFRSIQQLTFNKRSASTRFGHRLRTDQTFEPYEKVRLRLRYRFSLEVPLQGKSLNDKEFYTLTSIEQIAIYQAANADWEQRLSVVLGYYFNGHHKIEFGLDYRLDNFLNEAGRHRLWTMMNYYLNL
jgi:hypothetical protein